MAIDIGGGYQSNDSKNRTTYIGEGYDQTSGKFYSPLAQLMLAAWSKMGGSSNLRNYLTKGFHVGGIAGPGWYQDPVTGKWYQRNGTTSTTGGAPPRPPTNDPTAGNPGSHGGTGVDKPAGPRGGTGTTSIPGRAVPPVTAPPPATAPPPSGGTPGPGGNAPPEGAPPRDGGGRAPVYQDPRMTAPVYTQSTAAEGFGYPTTAKAANKTFFGGEAPRAGENDGTGNTGGAGPTGYGDGTGRPPTGGGAPGGSAGAGGNDGSGGSGGGNTGGGGPDNDVPGGPPGNPDVPRTPPTPPVEPGFPQEWVGGQPPTWDPNADGGGGFGNGEWGNGQEPAGLAGYFMTELASKGFDPEVQNALTNSTMAAVGNKANSARSAMDRRVAATGNDAGYFGAMSDLAGNEAAATEEAARSNVMANAAEAARRKTVGEQGLTHLSDQELENEQFWAKLFGTAASKPRETTGQSSGTNINVGFGF